MSMTLLTSTPARSRPLNPHLFIWKRLGAGTSLLFLFITAVLTLAPIAYALTTSLRPPAESFTLPPRWIPVSPHWSNYQAVFTTVPFGAYLLNSGIVTVSIVIGQLITSSLAGYAFARFDFPGKDALFWLILATMMIPLQATIIPVFVEISRAGLADTRASLVITAVGTAFGTFLLRQYFKTIPNEYEEAALVDGAGHLTIFWSVYLPL